MYSELGYFTHSLISGLNNLVQGLENPQIIQTWETIMLTEIPQTPRHILMVSRQISNPINPFIPPAWIVYPGQGEFVFDGIVRATILPPSPFRQNKLHIPVVHTFLIQLTPLFPKHALIVHPVKVKYVFGGIVWFLHGATWFIFSCCENTCVHDTHTFS